MVANIKEHYVGGAPEQSSAQASQLQRRIVDFMDQHPESEYRMIHLFEVTGRIPKGAISAKVSKILAANGLEAIKYRVRIPRELFPTVCVAVGEVDIGESMATRRGIDSSKTRYSLNDVFRKTGHLRSPFTSRRIRDVAAGYGVEGDFLDMSEEVFKKVCDEVGSPNPVRSLGMKKSWEERRVKTESEVVVFQREPDKQDVQTVLESGADELTLIRNAVSGDADSFVKLYEAYVDKVYRHLYYRTGNAAVAEDLTAQAFTKAWQAMPRYKDKGKPFAWLLSIAHNLLIDHYRARRETVSADEVVVVDENRQHDPVLVSERRVENEALRIAISKLNRDQQAVVVGRYINGLEFSQIAVMLGKSEGAVRVILHRALVEMKDILRQEGVGFDETIVETGDGYLSFSFTSVAKRLGRTELSPKQKRIVTSVFTAHGALFRIRRDFLMRPEVYDRACEALLQRLGPLNLEKSRKGKAAHI